MKSLSRFVWFTLVIATAIGSVASVAMSEDLATTESAVKETIQQGLTFLAKDATAWRKDHNCVSCHHAGLVIWAMHESHERSYAVDVPLMNELTRWVAESGSGKTGVPRPAGIPKALNAKAVWLGLGLGAIRQPDEITTKGLKLMLETIREDQLKSGAWASWPETRPPIFGNSDDSMTALATLALHARAQNEESVKHARDNGVKWLVETKSDDDPQSISMRLVLWKRLDRPQAEIDPLVRQILDHQHDDGGWSQSKEMTSDAWATGQALYALAHAGLTPKDSAIARGQHFLMKTQRDDGSWLMTSRPTKSGGDGSSSLIPITGAGAAWAVLGLVRSVGNDPKM